MEAPPCEEKDLEDRTVFSSRPGIENLPYRLVGDVPVSGRQKTLKAISILNLI
jgi:hypothetical protein